MFGKRYCGQLPRFDMNHRLDFSSPLFQVINNLQVLVEGERVLCGWSVALVEFFDIVQYSIDEFFHFLEDRYQHESEGHISGSAVQVQQKIYLAIRFRIKDLIEGFCPEQLINGTIE